MTDFFLKEYNQQPGERYEDWKYRVGFAKIEKLIDKTWEEIVVFLKCDCSSEHFRKIMYGAYEYVENLKINRTPELTDAQTSKLELLEIATKKLEMTKQQVADERRELRKSKTFYYRKLHLEEEILKEIKNLNNKTPLIVDKSPSVHDSETEAVLLISDAHVGKWIANYKNVYNEKVFEERIQTLIKETIVNCKTHNVTKLHVFVLGDLINGLIHINTRLENNQNCIQQTIFAAETLANALTLLSKEFDEVKAYFVRGNHDRITPNKEESIREESFFDFVPWFLEARLIQINNLTLVKNELHDEIILTDILGYKCIAVHGHNNRMSSIVADLTGMTKQVPDYIFTGHFHHHKEDEVYETEVIINPSLCGTDEYALSKNKSAKAAQKLLIFNKQKGRFCTYNIKVA